MSFGRMPEIIDTHAHVYPPSVASRIARMVSTPEAEVSPSRVMVEGILEAQRRAGISLSVNLPVATKAEHVEGTNAFVKTLPKGILSFAAFHPDVPDPADALRRIKEAGFKGIKFHPEFQQFTLDEKRMLPIWEEMSALGLIAYLHAGGDRNYLPPFHTTPKSFVAFARDFPALQIVAAHMGGYMMWYESELELVGRANIYLDTSWLLCHCYGDQAVRLMRRHGVEKILFATDSPWREPIDDVRAFERLALTEEERELILHKNAERLLRSC